MLSWVLLAIVPPSTATVPQVSPTPMALPALPPLLTSPIATAPPLAEAVATPPLPAEAVSVNCISLRPPCGPPRSPSAANSCPPGLETGAPVFRSIHLVLACPPVSYLPHWPCREVQLVAHRSPVYVSRRLRALLTFSRRIACQRWLPFHDGWRERTS